MNAASIRVVLVETTHPGNIGAAARAMKTMGLERLYLVRPREFPSAEATARASGADDLLGRAVVCDSIEAAIAGCSWVVGASARMRSLEWPLLDPREAASQAVRESGGEVAFLFGRERNGLTNAELDLCHALVHIPANPDYSSLNLAQAVQVVAYELRMAQGAALPEREAEFPPATAEEMEGFYAHLEQTLYDLEFITPERPGRMMPRLRRLFQRARPDRNEINILRGILAAVQDKRLKRQ